jgi:hypothetical protein
LYNQADQLHKDCEHKECQGLSVEQGFAVQCPVVDVKAFFEDVDYRVPKLGGKKIGVVRQGNRMKPATCFGRTT